MQSELRTSVFTFDIINFLEQVQPTVNSLEELIVAIREENERVEKYGQKHLNELLEISAYQWQLEQVEMKLKAPSLISISFLPQGAPKPQPKSAEDKVEAILMRIIIDFIRGNHNGHGPMKLTRTPPKPKSNIKS